MADDNIVFEADPRIGSFVLIANEDPSESWVILPEDFKKVLTPEDLDKDSRPIRRICLTNLLMPYANIRGYKWANLELILMPEKGQVFVMVRYVGFNKETIDIVKIVDIICESLKLAPSMN